MKCILTLLIFSLSTQLVLCLSITPNPSTLDCGTTSVTYTFDCAFNGSILITSVPSGVTYSGSNIKTVTNGVLTFDVILTANAPSNFSINFLVLSSDMQSCAPNNDTASASFVSTCILPPNNDCVNAAILSIETNSCSPISFTTSNATSSGSTPTCGGGGYLDLYYTFIATNDTITLEIPSIPGTVGFYALYDDCPVNGNQIDCSIIIQSIGTTFDFTNLIVDADYYLQLLFLPSNIGIDQDICLHSTLAQPGGSPPVCTASNNGPVCDSNPVILNETGGNAVSWSWSGPAGATFDDTSLQSPTVNPAVAGDYTVTITDALGTTNTCITTVIINTLPVCTASNNGPACDGDPVTLNETGGNAVSWSWSGPPGATFDNTTLQSPNVDPALAGDYTVTITDTNGCINNCMTTVIVNTLPVCTASNNGPSCNGNQVILDETGGNAVSWSWSGPAGATFDDTSLQSPTVNPAVAGDYSVTITDTYGCISNCMTTVIVNTLPVCIASNNGPTCDGDSMTLNETGGNAVAWNWSGPAGATFDDTSLQSPTVDPAVAGDYTVTITDANGCISNCMTPIIVNTLPICTATNNGPSCNGDQVILNETGANAVAWYWTGPVGASFDDFTLQSPTLNLAIAGDYAVTITDTIGCISSCMTTVIVNNLPGCTASNNGPVCDGDPVILNETGGNAAAWNWTGPPGSTFDNSTLQSPTVDPAVGGNYTVEITDENGCISTCMTTVIVNAVIVIISDSGPNFPNQSYSGSQDLITTDPCTLTDSEIIFEAASSITLDSGFDTGLYNFEAMIGGCNP